MREGLDHNATLSKIGPSAGALRCFFLHQPGVGGNGASDTRTIWLTPDWLIRLPAELWPRGSASASEQREGAPRAQNQKAKVDTV
jgi:hypothetical protein